MRIASVLLTITSVGTLLTSCSFATAHARSVPHGSVTRLDGSTITAREIDATAERLMRAAHVPGLALAILNNGEIVYLHAFGLRSVEKQLPLTDTTLMHAASITKSMFAYMVMQLVQENKLDLDRPIQSYLTKPLPKYADYADLAGDARYGDITARMLLSHTSGLPNWRFFDNAGNLDTLGKLRILFKPGAMYSYSGEGIQLLQLVVEEITRKPLTRLMQDRVFIPLHMTRTSMVWEPRFQSDFANAYDEHGKSLGHGASKRARAAGSADTNIEDVATFMREVLRSTGMNRTTRDEMLRPQIRINSTYQFPVPPTGTTHRDDAIRLSYGLGWGLLFSPYGKAYFKEGHDDGWRNYMIAFDEPKTAIVILTNSGNGEGIFTELLSTLIGDTFTPSVWEHYVPYNATPSVDSANR